MAKEENSLYQNLVELHTHLGGSSAAHFLWELAHKQGIRLPTKDYWKFIDSITIEETKTYEEYLDYFHLTELIQSSTFGVERAVHHAISLLYRKGNITLAEIRFNPMLRNRNNKQDLDKIILGAVIGMKKACLEYPVKAGIILMLDRRFNDYQNKIIADKAIKFKNDGIVGLDIGGPLREDFTVDEVIPAFKEVKEVGLGTTFHSGEVTDTKEMWEVVEKINPDRIGHGIRAIEDEDLLKKLGENQTTLEICPKSNLRTGVVKDLDDFKTIFEKLEQYSIPYTINSDGPVFLQTHIMEEFKSLLEKGLIKEEDVGKLTQNARKASFIKD